MKRNREKRISETFLLLVLLLLLCPARTQAASFVKKAPEPRTKLKGNDLVISWKKRSDLSGYEVCTCNAKGYNRRRVKTTSSCKVTLRNLKDGKTYYYRVRGYSKKKNGGKKYTNYSKVLKVQVYRKSTLKKLLLTALQPVGSTMYVWGGGWNKADTGAGIDARTIGVSSRWRTFFEKQDSSYDYQTTRYQIRDGLDCSGYIGWCIYNILEAKNKKTGYVMSARKMAQDFASRGWGSYTEAGRVSDYRAGDIMSSSGHVWMVVGECGDGSVVLLHASPPGVQLAGTPTPDGRADSEAVALARKYMKQYFPEWYGKYPNCAKGSSYLTDYGRMRWDLSGNVIMSDPDHYRDKTADKILRDLFRSR